MIPPNTAPPGPILVIDDDGEVLDSVKRMLESRGFAVQTAPGPLEGLRLYEAHWHEIKLVLLDYFMHTMNGAEVFERFQRVNPHAVVLLMTGADADIAQPMLAKGLRGVIPKPLVPEEFIDRVQAELGSPAPADTQCTHSE